MKYGPKGMFKTKDWCRKKLKNDLSSRELNPKTPKNGKKMKKKNMAKRMLELGTSGKIRGKKMMR